MNIFKKIQRWWFVRKYKPYLNLGPGFTHYTYTYAEYRQTIELKVVE